MRYIIKGGVWKNSEDEILKAAVMKYGLNQWSRISSLLVRKSAKQCKQRWYEWLDPSIKKTEWTREEEEKLLHLAKIFPSQWRTIAPIVGRTPMQCVEKYEKLLDQAQGKDSSDPNDPRKLRPGEIDPHPETKPARPDPIDMDEDEKEMLAEARVRLANTKGKKAKRKARGKLIEEARRLAFLQKKRELKAAGLEYVNHRVEKPFIIRKLNLQLQGIDYNKEIAFERMVPEFVYKPPAEENPEANMKLSNVSLQQMEGRRRDEEEEARRKIDQRRMKKLKERELDQAVTLYNKTTNLLNLKKTKMMLPDPQLKDQDLELLGKLNAVNEVSEHTNAATRALVGNYSQRESTASVMRTPRAPNTVMREAQNMIALQQTETPLMGGENQVLQNTDQFSQSGRIGGLTPQTHSISTPNDLVRMLRTPTAQQISRPAGALTPAQSISRRMDESVHGQTPVHDAFRLNNEGFDGSWDEQSHHESTAVDQEKLARLRANQARQQILEGLKNLPQPKNEFTVQIPDIDSEHAKQEKPEVADAEDIERQNQKKQNKRNQIESLQRTQASQKNLVPPRTLPEKLYNDATGNNIRDKLEGFLGHHVLLLIREDQENYGQGLGNISQAQKVLREEIDQIRDQNGMDIETTTAYWDELRRNVVLENNEYVDLRESNNKLELLKSIYLKKYQTLLRIDKRNTTIQTKLQTTLRGYQNKMLQLEGEISKMIDQINQATAQTTVYKQALHHERKSYRERIDEVAKYHDMLLVKHNELQAQHKELNEEKAELLQEEGLFMNEEMKE